MNGRFLRFKRKFRFIGITKSILLGLFFGFVAGGVFLLLSKREIIPFEERLYLPIAIGVFVFFSATLYLVFRVSTSRAASRVDEVLSLDEKVQTMIQYRKQNETIVMLQRADTENTLAAANRGLIKFKFWWLFVLLALIGAAFFVYAYTYEIPEDPPEIEEEVPFKITALQIAAMEELIRYVDNSEMELVYKEVISASLKVLLEDLKIADTQKKKEVALKMAVDIMHKATSDSSSAAEILTALSNAEEKSVKNFAKQINYYDWKSEDGAELDGAIAMFRAAFVHLEASVNNPDMEKVSTETAALLEKTGKDISTALLVSGISKDDSLYSVLSKLTNSNEEENGIYGIAVISTLVSTKGYSAAQNMLDKSFEDAKGDFFESLLQMKTNSEVGEFALLKVSDLFDYDIPPFERPKFEEGGSKYDPSGSDGEDTDADINIKENFGSDDLVLDPDSGEYVPYKELYSKRNEKMLDMIKNGDYTPEQKEAIQKYFSMLSGGITKNND